MVKRPAASGTKGALGWNCPSPNAVSAVDDVGDSSVHRGTQALHGYDRLAGPCSISPGSSPHRSVPAFVIVRCWHGVTLSSH